MEGGWVGPSWVSGGCPPTSDYVGLRWVNPDKRHRDDKDRDKAGPRRKNSRQARPDMKRRGKRERRVFLVATARIVD